MKITYDFSFTFYVLHSWTIYSMEDAEVGRLCLLVSLLQFITISDDMLFKDGYYS